MNDWHYELALRQELEVTLEQQVAGWALEELDLFKEEVPIGAGPEGEAAGLAPYQFTQLLTVAEESASVPAVVNYLRYQIARSKPGEGWQWRDVGHQIVTLLEDAVRIEARSAANRAAARVQGRGAMATEGEQRQAWIQLTRLFLGVLRRRFVQRANDREYARRSGEKGGPP